MQMIIQIDGENFSIKRAHALLAIAQMLGCWQHMCIYGSKKCLQHWEPYNEAWRLAPRMHMGGWQAADRLLCEDARSFYQQGMRYFLLAADDGGYAALVRGLVESGCRVFGVGSPQAARKLRDACTTFFLASSTTQKKGNSMPSPQERDAFTSQRDLSMQLYGTAQFPAYLMDLLYYQLSHCIAMLSQGGEGRGMIGRPQEVVDFLLKMEEDPIFSVMLTKERNAQWERLLTFARHCDEAYERGMHAATTTSSLGLVLDPRNTFIQEVEQSRRASS
jgi:hypothetical protein